MTCGAFINTCLYIVPSLLLRTIIFRMDLRRNFLAVKLCTTLVSGRLTINVKIFVSFKKYYVYLRRS